MIDRLWDGTRLKIKIVFLFCNYWRFGFLFCYFYNIKQPTNY